LQFRINGIFPQQACPYCTAADWVGDHLTTPATQSQSGQSITHF